MMSVRALLSAAITVLVSVLLISAAHAVNPDEVLEDPALEARAREISAELRCLVCQNQSIDDSDAELARDLRVLVRERLVEGDSNQDVFNYVVSRYGEFVLLKPRLSVGTFILWGAPVILLLAGLIAMFVFSRTRATTQPLSADEQAEIDRIMKGEE